MPPIIQIQLEKTQTVEKYNLKSKHHRLWQSTKASRSLNTELNCKSLTAPYFYHLLSETEPCTSRSFRIRHSRQFCLHRAARAEGSHKEMEAAAGMFSQGLLCSSFYPSSQLFWCQESCSLCSMLLKSFPPARLTQSQGCSSLCCPLFPLHAAAGSMNFKPKCEELKQPFISKYYQESIGSNIRGTAKMPTCKPGLYTHLQIFYSV